MLSMTGSIFLTDSKEMIYAAITDPRKVQRCMALDMDEQSDEMKEAFPQDVVKATILLPPSTAVFRQIDGDQQGFIQEYFDYLNSDIVDEYNATILLMVHIGINAIIYIPSFSEDSIWVNVLLEFFESKYGLHIGTSQENGFRYNPAFDIGNINRMYLHNCIDCDHYIRIMPITCNEFPPVISMKLSRDLIPLTGPYENPQDAFYRIRSAIFSNPNVKPAVTFE